MSYEFLCIRLHFFPISMPRQAGSVFPVLDILACGKLDVAVVTSTTIESFQPVTNLSQSLKVFPVCVDECLRDTHLGLSQPHRVIEICEANLLYCQLLLDLLDLTFPALLHLLSGLESG
ncbi:hypothetical protein WJ16_21395 [Burkholderia metallica]|nr:hypothetical protein WJ16_21395 [Burkholderia metallica]